MKFFSDGAGYGLILEIL